MNVHTGMKAAAALAAAAALHGAARAYVVDFANARRMTLMPPQFRLFGRDISIALKVYLEPFKTNKGEK